MLKNWLVNHGSQEVRLHKHITECFSDGADESKVILYITLSADFVKMFPNEIEMIQEAEKKLKSNDGTQL